MTIQEMKERIAQLKREKNAVILAHYYARPEVQDVADYLGDSLGLSQEAAKVDADIIVFCGVHFMAETAAVISPNKKVLIPELGAGCSLAEAISGAELKKWKEEHPDGLVVSYVNTTADTKAYTDVCCTSANALQVVKSLPQDKEILFVPDAHLGAWIEKVTGRKMTLWSGNCCVHHIVDGDMVINAAQKYPEADILIHPESICSSDDRVLSMPNAYFYSTAGMVKHAKESSKKQFIIATEAGTIHKLQQDNPDKQFILIDDRLICSEMKKVTLEGVVNALEHDRFQVVLDEDMRSAAIKSIDAMLSL